MVYNGFINMDGTSSDTKWLILGWIVAIAVVGGGIWFFYATALPHTSQTASSTPTTSTAPAPSAAPVAVNATGLANSAATSTIYYLPKSIVPSGYAAIFTAIANTTTELENTFANELLPLLPKVETAAKSNDYPTLSALGEQIQTINTTQKQRVTILTADFKNLADVNSSEVTDQKLVGLTDTFISDGSSAVAAYGAINTLVDNVLVGNVSSSTPDETKTLLNDLVTKRTAFDAATKALSAYLNARLVSDAKAYAASTQTQ